MSSVPSSRSQVVHLHVHSEHSVLDGACNIKEMAARAAELDMPALALTDHGVMNGALDMYKACRANDIKPILGIEAYFVDDREAVKTAGRYERNHLTLLAENNTGFENLVALSSEGFLEGYHRGKANVDMELLSRHSEGVIVLTGCLQARFVRRLVEDRPDEAREHLDQLIEVFGPEQVYLEVQKNGIAEQNRANEQIASIAREVGRPLVGTADVHYLREEDHLNHSALLCVQTKSTLSDPKMKFDTNEFFLKDAERMHREFAEWPEAIPSTLEIADRTEIEIPLGRILLPSFPTGSDETESGMLRRLAEQGLKERYGDPVPAEARERMEFELKVIEEMGFPSYFLIVWDFVHYAKENGIAVGPGRGSAAGSIVSYALGITDLDPVEHDLLFERFLNPGRKSMPDIDIDFSVRGRDRMIAYVTEKYGADSVAQIITFGKMAPRAAVRDAARVHGFDYATGDRLAKEIPEPIMGRSPSFKECLEEGQDLRKTYDSDPDAAKIIDTARGLEGKIRNTSIHAAAVVISGRPLKEIVPLQLVEDKSAPPAIGEDGKPVKQFKTVTQYSMVPIEEIGLLKMDFLGLRNLDVIDDAVDIIKRSRGIEIDIGQIPLDDPVTYEMLARGDSIGVFQLESDGMREAMRKVVPTEFDDITALVSLYRPGAMSEIPKYAKGKHDPESVEYSDERLREITESTYGCFLYQEQLMAVAKEMAGFSPSQADDLRKAIGKKKRDLMAEMKPKFMEGLTASGTDQTLAEFLWSTNEAAADYSFNKSHAACYALISYRTAYLKANYPAEYMAAVISSVMSTKDKVPFFVSHCSSMGIQVLPPDVNISDHSFVVDGTDIRFGLDAVKHVGYSAVEAIIRAREDRPFESLWDFCERVDNRAVNKRAVESLVKCGAFDLLPGSRQGMLERLPDATAAGAKAQSDAMLGQGSIFDLGGDEDQTAGGSHEPISEVEFSQKELLALEKEVMGTFLSSHPLDGLKEAILAEADCSLAELKNQKDGSKVKIGGLITEYKKIRSRKGKPIAFATLSDIEEKVELLLFDLERSEKQQLVQMDEVVMIKGIVDHTEDGIKIMVRDAELYNPSEAQIEKAREAYRKKNEPFVVRVAAEQMSLDTLEEMKSVFDQHQGDSDVVMVVDGERERKLKLGPDFRVRHSPGLTTEIDQIMGQGSTARAA
ncbi:MAG: DNA polymerase III subunit alpha [Solirubrobacterales bacterium]|nr:DNA polymerase III subunit alpha [Solirubrobacterales bacterium]